MKKFAYLLFCMTALSACAGLEEEAQKEVASFTQVPVSAAGQQVRIVVQKPADNCTFKGGIIGAANPNASGVLRGEADLSAQVSADLRNNAANMGGNTVWVKNTSWHNTDISYNYDNPFVVNNVEYNALVYNCPAQ